MQLLSVKSFLAIARLIIGFFSTTGRLMRVLSLCAHAPPFVRMRSSWSADGGLAPAGIQ